MSSLIRDMCISVVMALTFIPHNLMSQESVMKHSTRLVFYSPDGTQLVGISGGNLKFFFVGSLGKPNQIVNAHDQSIIFVDSDPKVNFFVTATRHEVKLWKFDGTRHSTLAYSAGEKIQNIKIINDKLLLIGQEQRLLLYSITSGKVEPMIWIKASIESFDVTERKVIVGTKDGKVEQHDLAEKKKISEISLSENPIKTVALSPDGSTIVASDKSELFILDGNSSKSIERIKLEVVSNDILFSHDNKYIFFAARKKGVVAYRLKPSQEALRLQAFDGDVSNLSISPDGQSLAAVDDYSGYVKIFDLSALKITPSHLIKNESDIAAPLIFIDEPVEIKQGIDMIVYITNQLFIRGSVFDDSGVNSLMINGIATPVKENGAFAILISLSPGENLINIEVSDINGNIAAKRFSIFRGEVVNNKYNPATAKNFLLVLGVDDYQHWPDLNNATRDAKEVYRVLTEKYKFEKENSLLLLDTKVTRTSVLQTLRSYIEKINNDNLLVYYSGHGQYDDLSRQGYWVPSEADHDESAYVSYDEIIRYLNLLNAQHILLIADACYSGSLFINRKRGYITNVESARSRWALASGRLEAVSDGSIGGHSPFAHHFLTYLENVNEEKFPALKLIEYVCQKVGDDAANRQQPTGNPFPGDLGFGQFVFYKK